MQNANVVEDTSLSDTEYVEALLGSRQTELPILILLLCIYGVIFIVGVIGNLVTCVVIYRVPDMRTPTNFFLFNLSISDLLVLIFMLPHDVYYFCYRYPYIFGHVGCIVKNLISEVCTCSSVLTVTAFTVERYLAICYPLTASKISSLGRARRVIAIIWMMAVLVTIPPVSHTGIIGVERNDSHTNFTVKTLSQSTMCTAVEDGSSLSIVFVCHVIITFIIPLFIISILYYLIGKAINQSMNRRRQSTFTPSNDHQQNQTNSNRGKRSVLNMLIAIVIAFFLCLAPLHAHRLFIALSSGVVWQQRFTWILNEILYYISGILFYANSIVNPILYHLMSGKFRTAFRSTFLSICGGNRGGIAGTLIVMN